MKIIKLKTSELFISVLSFIFGGFAITSNILGELESGYLYGMGSIIAGGIIIVKNRTTIKE